MSLKNDLKKYQKLRDIGLRFSQDLPDVYNLSDCLPSIIKVMGVGNGRNLVLESDEELNFMIDFYLHELLWEGQSILEQYRADNPELDPLETEYLNAAKASYTSLFKVTATDPRQNSLTVTDLLNPSHPPLSVLNVNLSKSAKVNHLIFSRLLPYEDFNAFSGMFAAFNPGSDRPLLKRYKVVKKRVKSDRESVQRFVAFFKLNRLLGIASKTI